MSTAASGHVPGLVAGAGPVAIFRYRRAEDLFVVNEDRISAQVGIISSEKLLGGKSRLIVIDARSPQEFYEGHIPGALSLGWEEFCDASPGDCRPILAEPGYWGLLADPVRNQFARRLSLSGLSNDSEIVVYGDGVASKGREGRIGWMLLYLGATRVRLLDGGWRAWLAAGGAVEQGMGKPGRPGRFQLAINNHRRIRLADLQVLYQVDRLPLLIDTRSQLEFQGLCHDYQPRKGRLPRSVLIPFDALYDSTGAYLQKEHYLRLLAEAAGGSVSPVAYCEVGVRAATFALIHEVHTGQIIPVYDGSLMEWSVDVSLPVWTGSALPAI